MAVNITIDVAAAEAIAKLKSIEKAIADLQAKSKKDYQLGNIPKISFQRDVADFKTLQTSIKATKQELITLGKQASKSGGVFNFSQAHSQIDALTKKLNTIIPATESTLTKGMTHQFKPFRIQGDDYKIKYQGVFDSATKAFEKTNAQLVQATIASEKFGAGISNSVSVAAKAYKSKVTEIVKDNQSAVKEISAGISANLKSTAYLASSVTKKYDKLTTFGGVDAEVKKTIASTQALTTRMGDLQKGMSEAFKAGRGKAVIQEMGVLKGEMRDLIKTSNKPLYGTKELRGEIALLEEGFKSARQEQNKLINPRQIKSKPLIPIDTAANLQQLQTKFAAFGQSVADIQSRIGKRGFGFSKAQVAAELANIEALKTKLIEMRAFSKAGKISGMEVSIKGLAKSKVAIKELENSLKKGVTQKNRVEVLGAKKAAGILKEIQAKMRTLAFGRVHLNLEGARESLKGFFSFVNKNARFLGNELSTIGNRLTRYVSLPLALAGGYALRTAGQFEAAEVAFTALTKSAGEGKFIFEELKEFSKTAPVDVNALFMGAKQMLGLGFATKEVIPNLKIISEGMAAIGADSGIFSRIVLALSQIKGKGKLVGEELRQIGNIGLVSIEAVAKKFKLNVDEFYKAIEKRAISGEDAVTALLQVMSEKFSGFLETYAKTIPGRWQVLVNNFKIFASELGEVISGIFNVPENLTRLAAMFNYLTDSLKSLNPAALEVTAKVLGMVAAVGLLIAALGKLMQLYAGLKSLWLLAFSNPWTAVIAGLIILMGVLITLISSMNLNWSLAFADMKDKWDEWSTAIDEWIENSTILTFLKELIFLKEKIAKMSFKSGVQAGADSASKARASGQEKWGAYVTTEDTADLGRHLILKQHLKKLEEKRNEDLGKWIKNMLALGEKGRAEIEARAKEGLWHAPTGLDRYKFQATDRTKKATGLSKEEQERYAKAEAETKAYAEALNNLQVGLNTAGEASDKLAKLQQALEADLRESAIRAAALGADFNKAAFEASAFSKFVDGTSKIAHQSVEAFEGMSDAAKKMADLEIEGRLFDSLKKLQEESQDAATHFEIYGDSSKYLEDMLKNLENTIADLEKTPFSENVAGALAELKERLAAIQDAGFSALGDRVQDLYTKIESLGGVTSQMAIEFGAQNEELLESGNMYKIAASWAKYLGKELNKLHKDAHNATEKLNEYMNTLKPEVLAGFIAQLKGVWDTLTPEEQIAALQKLVTEHDSAVKSIVQNVGNSIKGIWNDTAMTLKDVWHRMLDDFTDIMANMVIEYVKAQKAMKDSTTGGKKMDTVEGAKTGSSGGVWGVVIGAVIGALMSAYNGSQRQAKELVQSIKEFSIKLTEVFNNFIVNFKSALGDFKNILFPPKQEAGKQLDKINTFQKAMGMGSEFLEEAGSHRRMADVSDSKTFRLQFNKLLEELGISVVNSSRTWYAKILNNAATFSVNTIRDKMVTLATQLGESVVEFTELMTTRFNELKTIVEETMALDKEKADFTKRMDKALVDIQREGLPTPDLFKEQQKDVSALSKGLADFLDPQTQLAEINKIKSANYALEIQEKRISQLKIDDARLTLDKIEEIKDANLELWDTVKTLINESIDLITAKSGFADSIQDAITGIKRSVMTPTELYQAQLGDINSVLAQIAATADEQAKLPLYEQLKGLYQTAYQTSQQVYDPASIRSQLEGLYERGRTETNLDSLRDIGNQIRSLESSLIIADSGSRKAMDFAINGLTSLGEKGKSSYDKILAVNLDALGIQGNSSTWLEQLNDATGDWQTVIEANLKDLTKSGASAYDVLIAENLAMLNIETAQLDIQGQMKDYLSALATDMNTSMRSLLMIQTLSTDTSTKPWFEKLFPELGSTIDDIEEKTKLAVALGVDTAIEGWETLIDTLVASTSPIIFLLDQIGKGMYELFEKPKIAYAQGGLVTKPTYALVGEEGPELVLPLNKPDRMKKLLDSISSDKLPRPKITTDLEDNEFSGLTKMLQKVSSVMKDMGQQSIKAFKYGGIVQTPTLGLVGEAGPEAIIPLSQYDRGSSGEKSINFNFSGPVVTDEIMMSRWARSIMKYIDKERGRTLK